MNIRQFISPQARLKIKLAQRKIQDKWQGYEAIFAQSKSTQEMPYHIQLEQPIRKSHLHENKVHNIRLASQRIEAITILPNQILSFWDRVGAPTQANGYKKGRNIIAGKLQEDYGGGLCQISGIIYYLALQANLKIIERHNHSRDIYTDETRFTPLGTDATVVYGYKDLRILNTNSFPIAFKFEVTATNFKAYLKSAELIHPQPIQFEIRKGTNQTYVIGKNDNGLVVNRSVYKIEIG